MSRRSYFPVPSQNTRRAPGARGRGVQGASRVYTRLRALHAPQGAPGFPEASADHARARQPSAPRPHGAAGTLEPAFCPRRPRRPPGSCLGRELGPWAFYEARNSGAGRGDAHPSRERTFIGDLLDLAHLYRCDTRAVGMFSYKRKIKRLSVLEWFAVYGENSGGRSFQPGFPAGVLLGAAVFPSARRLLWRTNQ